MKSKLQYKGYTGYFLYSKEDDAFCGTIEDIQNSVVIYSGRTISEIVASFREMVEGEIEDGKHANYKNYNPKEPLIMTLHDEEMIANTAQVEMVWEEAS